MASTPRISVVLPVHNGERYLGEAAASLLAQREVDFEIVAVDDGSTDGTPGRLAELQQADARVRVISQERSGLVAALNRGCGEARGFYIARMDCDDVALPGRLARQSAWLDAHPGVVVLGGAVELAGAGNRTRRMEYPTEPAAVRAALARWCCLAHPAVVMRKDAFERAGGYRAAFPHAEDYDLWLRLAERHDLANLPEPVLRYRLHGGQVSFANIPQQVVSTLGARTAAVQRVRSGVDPVPAGRAADRLLLQRWGVSNEAIEDAIAQEAFDRASLLAELGLGPEAAAILAEAARLSSTAPAFRKRRGDFLWLEGKLLAAAGRYPASFTRLLRASLLRPALAGRSLARALGRGTSAALPSRG